AISESARDREADVVASARQPRPRHGHQPLGRDRHVHQGLPGSADQDRHRGGRHAAQADLRVSTNPAVGTSGAAALEGRTYRSVGLGRRLREFIEREWVFSWLILTPPLLFLLCFLGYPFFYGVYLSFFRREVAGLPTFVGFGNFVTLASDPIFWQSVGNTIKFTAAATVLKATGGLGMALVMNQNFRMKAITRALLLLPFIVPTVLSTVAWQLIFDSGLGLFHRLLVQSGPAAKGR